jgi:hypothetical protein
MKRGKNMKITTNELRRIIKEEVESVMRMNETDESRVNAINRAIKEMENLRDSLQEQGIDTSELEKTIETLEAQLTMPDAFKAGGVIDDGGGTTDEMGVVHELIQAVKKLLSRSELASTDPTRFLMLVDSTLRPFLRRKRPESRPMWWGKFSEELNILVDTIRSEDTEDIVGYLKLALRELNELLKEKDMSESRRRTLRRR